MKESIFGFIGIVGTILLLIAFFVWLYTGSAELSKARSYCRFELGIEEATRDKHTGKYFCEIDGKAFPISDTELENYNL